MDADDQRLVACALAGERPAFVSLVDRYRGRVYSIAKAVLDDHERAVTVTRKTFVRAHGELGQVGSPERFASWLARLALASAHEARGRLDRAGDSTVPEAPRVATGQQDEALLGPLLGALPERVRIAMDLHFREKLGYSEIAELLEEKPDLVRELLASGLSQLREKLLPFLKKRLRDAGA